MQTSVTLDYSNHPLQKLVATARTEIQAIWATVAAFYGQDDYTREKASRLLQSTEEERRTILKKLQSDVEAHIRELLAEKNYPALLETASYLINPEHFYFPCNADKLMRSKDELNYWRAQWLDEESPLIDLLLLAQTGEKVLRITTEPFAKEIPENFSWLGLALYQKIRLRKPPSASFSGYQHQNLQAKKRLKEHEVKLELRQREPLGVGDVILITGLWTLLVCVGAVLMLGPTMFAVTATLGVPAVLAVMGVMCGIGTLVSLCMIAVGAIIQSQRKWAGEKVTRLSRNPKLIEAHHNLVTLDTKNLTSTAVTEKDAIDAVSKVAIDRAMAPVPVTIRSEKHSEQRGQSLFYTRKNTPSKRAGTIKHAEAVECPAAAISTAAR